MDNSDRLAEALQDSSDVVLFKLALADKLKAVTDINFGVCHIQSLLDTAIDNETSRDIGTLSLKIKTAIDYLRPTPVSVKTIIAFVTVALEETMCGYFEEGNSKSRCPIDDEYSLGAEELPF